MLHVNMQINTHGGTRTVLIMFPYDDNTHTHTHNNTHTHTHKPSDSSFKTSDIGPQKYIFFYIKNVKNSWGSDITQEYPFFNNI